MNEVTIGIFIGIVGILAVLFFLEWFFGPPDDPGKGFPRSKRKHP